MSKKDILKPKYGTTITRDLKKGVMTSTDKKIKSAKYKVIIKSD